MRKVNMTVQGYDEASDSFFVLLHEAGSPREHFVDAELFATLVNKFDEPSEFIGQTFTLSLAS